MPVTFVRPRILYAWRGPSFVVVNTHGECSDRETLSPESLTAGERDRLRGLFQTIRV